MNYLVLFVLLFANSIVVLADSSTDKCFEALDALIARNSAKPAEVEKFRDDLTQLGMNCPKIPHIQHDLAVLYAKKQQWPAAIEYFEKSLTLDARAKQSYDALAKIYRFQAVRAYRDALQSNSPEPEPPNFDLQDSTITNFQSEAISICVRNNDSLREELKPLLGTWWRKTIIASGDCQTCFTEAYAAKRGESTMDRKPLNPSSSNAPYTLPDFMLMPVTDEIVAVVRTPAEQVLSLRIRQTSGGWRIYDERML